MVLQGACQRRCQGRKRNVGEASRSRFITGMPGKTKLQLGGGHDNWCKYNFAIKLHINIKISTLKNSNCEKKGVRVGVVGLQGLIGWRRHALADCPSILLGRLHSNKRISWKWGFGLGLEAGRSIRSISGSLIGSFG